VITQIRPLNDEESHQYIAHRLRQVESDITKVFTPEAVSLICQYSRGNPRTINVLGDNAFLIGYGLSKKTVDSDIVTEALEDLDFVGQKEFPEWYPRQGRKFGTPSMKEKNVLFRKISYSLLALVGVGVIIFLGRIFLKGPEEQPATRFPIQPPTAREKVALAPPEAKPDLVAKEVPKPDARPKPPAPAAPERKPSTPPAAQEAKRSIPPPTVERKPAAPASEVKFPISPPAKEVKKEPEQKVAVTKPIPAPPASQAPVVKTEAQAPVKKAVVVRAGDSIYTIAAKNYRVANTSVVDQILESNPKIANPNKLMANQKIRLPEITEESLVIESSDGTYKVHLGTFLRPEYSTFLEGEPALQGKAIEIIPR
jgi:phage tail protein X